MQQGFRGEDLRLDVHLRGLKSVDPSGIQTLMRSCEKDKTALALKRVSEELKDLFFSNMSNPPEANAQGHVGLRPGWPEGSRGSPAGIGHLGQGSANRDEIVIGGGSGGDQLVF